MSDPALVDAFCDAIREQLDAEEFEWMMLGKPERHSSENWRLIHTYGDLVDLDGGWGDEPSALHMLKASRALEALKDRFPEIWERVAMTEAVNA